MISHKHKTIFVHIPKCGGQSIEDAFIKDNGLTWDSRDPLLLRRNSNALVGPPWLAHLTAMDYLEHCYISKEIFEEYYKFTVVRDPYYRVASIYNYLGYNCALSFDEFIKKIVVKETVPGAERFYFFRPQMDFIVNKDGVIQVDDVFRLEDINGAQRVILEKANLAVREFEHVNKSRERGFFSSLKRRYEYARKGHISFRFSSKISWSPESRDIINSIYRRDFDGLGYPIWEQGDA